jgi:hypothetical protein
VLREVCNPPRNVPVRAAQPHQIADTTAIVKNVAVGGLAIPRHEGLRAGLEGMGSTRLPIRSYNFDWCSVTDWATQSSQIYIPQ